MRKAHILHILDLLAESRNTQYIRRSDAEWYEVSWITLEENQAKRFDPDLDEESHNVYLDSTDFKKALNDTLHYIPKLLENYPENYSDFEIELIEGALGITNKQGLEILLEIFQRSLEAYKRDFNL